MSQEHHQYGNNFYMLFEAKKVALTDPQRMMSDTYLKKAEQLYALQWDAFLNENAVLIEEIFSALEGVAEYVALRKRYKELLKTGELEQADRFDEDTNFELVGVEAWNVLNPLLKEAGRRMAEYGIEQQVFFG
ncbi:hypothetical protein C5B42_01965 [Candidatus Cerribacteria bacterium 'Amazon FNV 2010 28 9']|uniref:Uncharacterized protein n=1 Tax=Candidatus Cerribacteria bacterium 'Amazon FNV 2010 28 9' TaxID=2081795 RepID=A0A317JQR4_9BACT|nr:MAG: hypothetical protein C5B42_01965 [Candidatus Cerribacteria bacterium 'Amazon FNV 2010 28 9']